MAAANDHGRRLAAAAQALAIELDEGKASALLGYVAQLERWNRTYNLTAVRNADQMLAQHLFDSLAVAAPLATVLDKNTVNAPRIMDVGSGAGLPGAVLAIVYPQWQVYCVDAVEKKTAFIRQIAGALRLPNLHAVHGRVEAMEPLEADIVISRAFASLVDLSLPPAALELD
ncbi:MAG: 16S rRNA (guanine(527)-N(7))-methyltransferase RsmG, partial [Pollutimonas bauzanensis]